MLLFTMNDDKKNIFRSFVIFELQKVYLECLQTPKKHYTSENYFLSFVLRFESKSRALYPFI